MISCLLSPSATWDVSVPQVCSAWRGTLCCGTCGSVPARGASGDGGWGAHPSHGRVPLSLLPALLASHLGPKLQGSPWPTSKYLALLISWIFGWLGKMKWWLKLQLIHIIKAFFFNKENRNLFKIFISQHCNDVLVCTKSSKWFPGGDKLLYPQLQVGKLYSKTNVGFCVPHSKPGTLCQWSSAVEERVIHSYLSKASVSNIH